MLCKAPSRLFFPRFLSVRLRRFSTLEDNKKAHDKGKVQQIQQAINALKQHFGNDLTGHEKRIQEMYNSMQETPDALKGVSGTYVQALYTMAEKDNKLDEIITDFKKFLTLRHPVRGWGLVSFTILDEEQRKEHAKSMCAKAEVSDVFTRFISTLAANGRFDLYERIQEKYETYLRIARNQEIASIISAEPLTEDQYKRIEEKMRKMVVGKNLMITRQIDPKLIGGFVMRIGFRQEDFSVARAVNRQREVYLERFGKTKEKFSPISA
eukprot:TRINITY_DN316_c0_g1_i1.p1 TRINITY_DN316_c0_g1~~TRINITY_DN316_c0_g1_i1.p1  ORF type:complete len:267 (-),score=60.02 TRINITY_DN316_c0_g1_i1:619-1419(-)